VLDLDPDATNAERMIYRLPYENAQLVSRVARAGLPTAIEDPIDRVRETFLGRDSKPDPIAQLAAGFAAQVMQLASIQTDRPDDHDAAKVNKSIKIIAGKPTRSSQRSSRRLRTMARRPMDRG
jgi:hypothetical protein